MLNSPDVQRRAQKPLGVGPFILKPFTCSNIPFLSRELLYNQKVDLLSEPPRYRAVDGGGLDSVLLSVLQAEFQTQS